MLADDLWIGALSASLLTGTSRQNCYRLADTQVLKTRHDEKSKRLLFSVRCLADRSSFSLNEEACQQLALADEGDAAAMREFGLFLLENQHGELAVGWLLQAAENHDPDAMDWLSTCFLEGIGTAIDPAQALRWLGEAAMRGHAIAQAKLQAIT